MTDHPKLVKAARLLAQAREIKDRQNRPDEPLSKADADQIDALLRESQNLRKDAEREAALAEGEGWLSQPQYKHDMTGSGSAGSSGIDPISGKAHRPGFEADSPVVPGFKQFAAYLRGAPGAKAALVEDATGQTVVPTDFAGVIVKALAKEAVMRQIAFVRPTTRNKVDIGSVVVGTPTWGKLETGATAPDGLGATPAAKDTIEVHDLTALAKIGVDELEDADEILQPIITQALAAEFAATEDAAFFGGDGNAKPWAATHNVTQNVTAAANNTPTPDDLKRLPFKIPARHRKNGVFVGHSAVEEAVALMKDNEGNYLFQPSAAAGEPGTLFGYKWYTADGLPAPTANGAITDPSVLFGDFRSGYMIADRRRFTVQVLRELYAAEGKVGLLCTLRVGGDVIRAGALAKYLL